ncbi:tetratricopeptide repeat protein [Azospirillum cavernae]|nr:hypothetical protein [Azospirillum cavernae]
MGSQISGASDSRRALPERPNLDHLKKEAKRQLKELRLVNPTATLATAQFATARDYGFASWSKLKAHVTGAAITATADFPDSGVLDMMIAISTRIRHGQIDEAEQMIRQAIKGHPDNADLIALFGDFTLRFRGDRSAATDIYNRLLERPSPTGLAHCAGFVGAGEDVDKAEALYRRAIEMAPAKSPELGMILNNFASFLENRKSDSVGANAIFQRAAGIDYGYPQLNASYIGAYAEFLWRQGDLHQAEDCFRQSRKASTNHPITAMAFALLLTTTGRIDEGLALIAEVKSSAWMSTLYDPLPVELLCGFLFYAHGTVEQRGQALSHLRDNLTVGRNVFCRDLRANARAAVVNGHPAPALVSVLADVLSSAKPVSKAACQTLRAR